MTDLERDVMLQQLHQAVVGIPGTADKGMLGDMKQVKETIKSVCDDQNKLKGTVHNLIWFLGGTGVLTAGAIAKLLIG